ncbi:HNH endonuclease [Streptomyces sp. NPDC005098]|uniref:HNH endonuclease n=1 Tax=Streptomyces sp. NPDC005098 TaxID=3154560 RepID=UPI0033A8BBA8
MLLLELDRAEVAEPFLDAPGIIETVDLLEEREVRLGPGHEDAAADALRLDQHPQIFREGVIVRISDRSHGCLNSRTYRRAACRSTHGDPAGQRCYLCWDLILTEDDAHADHLVPQSKGGSDDGYKVRWTHGTCNQSRGDKPTTITQLLRIVPGILPVGHPLRIAAGA